MTATPTPTPTPTETATPTPTPVPVAVVTASATPTPVPAVIAPAATPTWGRRYAIGDPGSFLGTKFSPNGTATGTGSKSVASSEATLKPGSRAYGITPPAGKFVRWYPAARWAAGIT